MPKLIVGGAVGELSVFIDESGNLDPGCKYYLLTLVFHEQSRPIDNEVARLAGQMRDISFPLDVAVHCGPLVRREEMYAGMSYGERKRIFSRLHSFTLRAGIAYGTFAYRKSELGAAGAGDVGDRLRARLTRDMKLFLRDRLGYFTGFDRVIVYYDNGQHVVAAAVREAFEGLLFGVEFRLVKPSDYRLFQAADLICTLELLRLKADAGELSRGEVAFFGGAARLRKNYLRQLSRLRLE